MGWRGYNLYRIRCSFLSLTSVLSGDDNQCSSSNLPQNESSLRLVKDYSQSNREGSEYSSFLSWPGASRTKGALSFLSSGQEYRQVDSEGVVPSILMDERKKGSKEQLRLLGDGCGCETQWTNSGRRNGIWVPRKARRAQAATLSPPLHGHLAFQQKASYPQYMPLPTKKKTESSSQQSMWI